MNQWHSCRYVLTKREQEFDDQSHKEELLNTSQTTLIELFFNGDTTYSISNIKKVTVHCYSSAGCNLLLWLM